MRTVLVTGANGFLGRYIVRHLARRNWRVVGTVRRSSTLADLNQPELSMVESLDLCDSSLDNFLCDTKPKVIVHAAGPASVPDSMVDPHADYRASVESLRSVLRAVRRTLPDCRVVFLSSAAVYGNPRSLPVSEDAPLDPLSPYGAHKFLAESLLEDYHREYGIRCASVRVFSAYGPGLRRQVFWDACKAIQGGSPVRLLGTGDETRDFIHAADVALGVEVVVERAAFTSEVYNLAVGRETPISELARMLAGGLNRKPDIQFSGVRRDGDPVRWCADIRRLRELGFAPEWTLERGVEDYAAWFLAESDVRGVAQGSIPRLGAEACGSGVRVSV